MTRSQMERMRAPQVPEQPVLVLTDDQLRALLALCAGKGFTDRREAGEEGAGVHPMRAIRALMPRWRR